jgi:hypothetical protein
MSSTQSCSATADYSPEKIEVETARSISKISTPGMLDVGIKARVEFHIANFKITSWGLPH